MKKIAVLALMLFAFTGCMTIPTYEPFNRQSLEQGSEMTAGIGDIFFEYSTGQDMKNAMKPEDKGFVASGEKVELTIVELNKERLGLQYNEYTHTPPQAIGLSMYGGGWMVKQGFNKRFDYALADKIVRFKGYEFEIVSVENGQLKYKRVK